jgi:hypothetical protein
VWPQLLPGLSQLVLAAQPMTGTRGVLGRRRCPPGVRTPAQHQLRQSCLSAGGSGARGGCPVRPLRLRDGGWPEHAAVRVGHPSYLPACSAWLCPSPCAMSSGEEPWTRMRAVELSPFRTDTDLQGRERCILRCLVPTCSTPLSLSGSSGHYWQG